MSEPLLNARGVEVGYRRADGTRHTVLRGVDLALARGELVGLLGPNGSGKTTLLRCLAGTLRADAGEISLFGRDVGSWTRLELARRIAVLPQSMSLPDGFRVAELVEMGRAPHARRFFGASPADGAAIERALADTDALDLADRLASELSGGEHQRVLVAMTLAQEPELLLLDEPTRHLDVGHQGALLATIERLRQRRRLTVLAVVHDLNLAAAFMPRVALLGAGRIVAEGAPDEVLRIELVRELFGVAMQEAFTAEGARFLALRRASDLSHNEPLTHGVGIPR